MTKQIAVRAIGRYNANPALETVPKAIGDQVLELALERTDLSPRELACRFADENGLVAGL